MLFYFSKLMAAAYVLGGLWLSFNHPLMPSVALVGFAMLAVIGFASETLWLAALPSVLALGSLFPWTGQLLFCEYDIGLCALLGGRLVGLPWLNEKTIARTLDSKSTRYSMVLRWLWILAALVLFVGGIRGWSSLPLAISADQLSLYTTKSNALLQSKALFYGLALVPLIVAVSGSNHLELRKQAWARIEAGFLISATAVVAVVLAERFVTVGLWDWNQEMRAAGPCMTMHIGDQHIDAYWAIALPFVLPSRWSLSAGTGLRCLLCIFVAYAIFATMSRATIVSAFVVVTVLLIFQSIRSTSREFQFLGKGLWAHPAIRKFCFAAGSFLGLLVTGLVFWNSGDAVPARFQALAEGLQARRSHWQSVMQMGVQAPVRLLIGSGLGTYPIEYRKHVGRVEQPIRLVELSGSDIEHSRAGHSDAAPCCMRLFAGEKIYATQLLPTSRPLPWTVELLVRRSSFDCDIGITVCHQVLTQSSDCVVPATESAHEIGVDRLEKISFELTEIPDSVVRNEDKWRRVWSPTALSLTATGNRGSSIEVFEVLVTDGVGNSILKNPDFGNGSRFWFFVSDDHLVWRAKNCFLHMFIETGLLGLCVVVALCYSTLVRNLQFAVVQKSWPAFVTSTSLLGFLSIGLFGTLIDAPWIALLVIMQLAILFRVD